MDNFFKKCKILFLITEYGTGSVNYYYYITIITFKTIFCQCSEQNIRSLQGDKENT